METLLGWGTLVTGIVIFLARIVDVSLGTMRTISTVHGQTLVSFILGFLEVSIWIFVISTVVAKIAQEPVLGLFYAFGFSTGNVVGIILEKRLALGHMVLRVFSLTHGKEIAGCIRENGYAVTTFQGEGRSGPVTQLYMVCRRRDIPKIIAMVNCMEPDAFYITEHPGDVNRVFHPFMAPVTGWRAIIKRK